MIKYALFEEIPKLIERRTSDINPVVKNLSERLSKEAEKLQPIANDDTEVLLNIFYLYLALGVCSADTKVLECAAYYRECERQIFRSRILLQITGEQQYYDKAKMYGTILQDIVENGGLSNYAALRDTNIWHLPMGQLVKVDKRVIDTVPEILRAYQACKSNMHDRLEILENVKKNIAVHKSNVRYFKSEITLKILELDSIKQDYEEELQTDYPNINCLFMYYMDSVMIEKQICMLMGFPDVINSEFRSFYLAYLVGAIGRVSQEGLVSKLSLSVSKIQLSKLADNTSLDIAMTLTEAHLKLIKEVEALLDK